MTRYQRVLAVALLALALGVFGSALALYDQLRPPPGPAAGQVCAVLGAIMDDSDSTVGLFARAAQLYREFDCQ